MHSLSIHARDFADTATPLSLTQSSFPCIATQTVQHDDRQDAEEPPPSLDVRASLPQEYTSGHVLEVLNRKGAGGKPLEDEDFRILINAAKTPKDARVIMTALVNYKRINKFILTKEIAELAVKRILLADPDQGSIMVLKNFTEESGLYFSCEIPLLNLVLDDVLLHIQDHDKRDLWKALISMLNLLIYRKTRPYKKMKKKAERKYHKHIQLHHGPTVATVQRMVEIGLKIRAAKSVHSQITTPCLNNRVPVLEETLRLVEQARFQEEMDSLAPADDLGK